MTVWVVGLGWGHDACRPLLELQAGSWLQLPGWCWLAAGGIGRCTASPLQRTHAFLWSCRRAGAGAVCGAVFSCRGCLACRLSRQTIQAASEPAAVYLLHVQERLEAVRAAVAEQSGELASGLQRRQAVAEARALLELMQARPWPFLGSLFGLGVDRRGPGGAGAHAGTPSACHKCISALQPGKTHLSCFRLRLRPPGLAMPLDVANSGPPTLLLLLANVVVAFGQLAAGHCPRDVQSGQAAGRSAGGRRRRWAATWLAQLSPLLAGVGGAVRVCAVAGDSATLAVSAALNRHVVLHRVAAHDQWSWSHLLPSTHAAYQTRVHAPFHICS